MMNTEEKKKLGKFCKEYRINTLCVSLTNFSKNCDENIKNISAFESGRANNIKYIFLYANYNKETKEKFIKDLFYIVGK